MIDKDALRVMFGDVKRGALVMLIVVLLLALGALIANLLRFAWLYAGAPESKATVLGILTLIFVIVVTLGMVDWYTRAKKRARKQTHREYVWGSNDE